MDVKDANNRWDPCYVDDIENYDGFTSRENLLRIQRNDPSLHGVRVRIDNGHPNVPLRGDSAEALGRGIGNNIHLRELELTSGAGINYCYGGKEAFLLLCEGISQNRSIETVSFVDHYARFGADLIQSLTPFFEHNNNLKSITFRGTDTTSSLLVAPLMRRVTPLETLDLGSSLVDSESVEALVAALQDNPTMTPKSICLRNNFIFTDACRSLATLLQDPRCKLEILDLSFNTLDDSSAILFANALIGNTNLKQFIMKDKDEDEENDDALKTSGFRAFSQTLCNTTNINTTYASNHTLQVLHCKGNLEYDLDYDSDDDTETELELHSDISQYLIWNSNENKKIVARKKVFMKHFVNNFTMEPFEGMEPELLVCVLHFMDKASEENGGVTNTTARNLILTQLITKDPMICDIAKPGPLQGVSDRKRKHK